MAWDKLKIIISTTLFCTFLHFALLFSSFVADRQENSSLSWGKESCIYNQMPEEDLVNTISSLDFMKSLGEKYLELENEFQQIESTLHPARFHFQEYFNLFCKIFTKSPERSSLKPEWFKDCLGKERNFSLFSSPQPSSKKPWVSFEEIGSSPDFEGLKILFTHGNVEIKKCSSSSCSSEVWYSFEWPLNRRPGETFTPKSIKIDGLSLVLFSNEIQVAGKLSLSVRINCSYAIEIHANSLIQPNCTASLCWANAKHSAPLQDRILTLGSSGNSKFVYFSLPDDSFSVKLHHSSRIIAIDGNKLLGTITVAIQNYGFAVFRWNEELQRIDGIAKEILPLDWIVRITEENKVFFEYKDPKYPMFLKNFYLEGNFLGFLKHL